MIPRLYLTRISSQLTAWLCTFAIAGMPLLQPLVGELGSQSCSKQRLETDLYTNPAIIKTCCSSFEPDLPDLNKTSCCCKPNKSIRKVVKKTCCQNKSASTSMISNKNLCNCGDNCQCKVSKSDSPLPVPANQSNSSVVKIPAPCDIEVSYLFAYPRHPKIGLDNLPGPMSAAISSLKRCVILSRFLC